MKKNILAIIPARSSSERLPGKNVKELNKKPLIAWTIESALGSESIDKIIISTDDRKVIEIGSQYGIEIPFVRPKKLSSATASSFEVIDHAIQFYKSKDEHYSGIMLLQPTSPIRTSEDIDNAVKLLDENTLSVISVCRSPHSPLWSNTLPDDLSMKNFMKSELKNTRSQDLPVYYQLNGAIYVSDTDYFLKNKGFFGERTKAYVMPEERSIDIDTLLDFKFAELLLKERPN